MNPITMKGIPSDRNSSFLKGARKAPAKIRELLASDMMNHCAENGLELGQDVDFVDGGDLLLDENNEQVVIQSDISTIVNSGRIPLLLGGDHAITYPIIKAIAAHHGRITILHIDAHPDLYEDYQGNRFSHASPFARIMEDDLARRLVQVGIRTLNPHQRQQAERYGVEIISMAGLDRLRTLAFDGPLYISIDLDGLDPAFAPGVSHHEPGGLSVRQVLEILRAIKTPVIGADIVEYNPDRDLNEMTAAVAAKLVKELAVLAAAGC